MRSTTGHTNVSGEGGEGKVRRQTTYTPLTVELIRTTKLSVSVSDCVILMSHSGASVTDTDAPLAKRKDVVDGVSRKDTNDVKCTSVRMPIIGFIYV